MRFDRSIAITGGMLFFAGITLAIAAAEPVKPLPPVKAESVKAEPAQAAPVTTASMVESLCAGCHGMDGISPASSFPHLAGQHTDYLLHEMELYKSKKRDNETMSPLVLDLSAQDLAKLAAYFSKQKPAPGAVNNPELLALGKKIYLQGNSDSAVPPCDICHAQDGHGIPHFPRVAGQYADYTIEQFSLYAQGGRKSPNNIMPNIAKRLTEAEIKAVAEYMASMN